MKIVKILGTGCTKCRQTEQIVRDTISSHHFEALVEKVEDINEIMKYDILSTPAVVVDEVVKIKGRVPNKNEVLKAIMD